MILLTVELPDEPNATLAQRTDGKACRSSSTRAKVLQHDLAPDWLRKSWQKAQESGLDQLSSDDIDAEIATARKARCESWL